MLFMLLLVVMTQNRSNTPIVRIEQLQVHTLPRAKVVSRRILVAVLWYLSLESLSHHANVFLEARLCDNSLPTSKDSLHLVGGASEGDTLGAALGQVRSSPNQKI